jgi:hypothetical protein
MGKDFGRLSTVSGILDRAATVRQSGMANHWLHGINFTVFMSQHPKHVKMFTIHFKMKINGVALGSSYFICLF